MLFYLNKGLKNTEKYFFLFLNLSLFSPAPLQDVHLEVVPIAGRNQEVNLTAIVLPIEANLTVFYWWIGDNLQVLCGN